MDIWVLIHTNDLEWMNEDEPSKSDILDALDRVRGEDVLDWCDNSTIEIRPVPKP